MHICICAFVPFVDGIAAHQHKHDQISCPCHPLWILLFLESRFPQHLHHYSEFTSANLLISPQPLPHQKQSHPTASPNISVNDSVFMKTTGKSHGALDPTLHPLVSIISKVIRLTDPSFSTSKCLFFWMCSSPDLK